jgi:hypothetical protein
MPAAPPVSVSVSVNPKDIARITKRLDKYQGVELAKRMDKAIAGGLALLVGPIRSGAARHTITGATAKSVKVKKLRKRAGEMVAHKVGVSTWYGHFPIAGPYNTQGDPYVDRAAAQHGEQVQHFINEQITRLR